MTDTLLLTLLIFAAALLYSSVGHAGASGYLAAMALFNLAPDVMKPTALVLNLVVATVGTIRYAQAGCFSWNIFWPFAVLSVPLAFLGGAMKLPIHAYKMVLAGVLLFAAWRLGARQVIRAPAELKPVVLSLALCLGAAIGLLSGLTGVGGGIFLSPLLLFLGWADVRRTAGVSVAFILVNSASGLLGYFIGSNNTSVGIRLPPGIIWWATAALLGGLIGSELGSRHLTPMTMRRLLAVVLVIAGGKMLLS